MSSSSASDDALVDDAPIEDSRGGTLDYKAEADEEKEEDLEAAVMGSNPSRSLQIRSSQSTESGGRKQRKTPSQMCSCGVAPEKEEEEQQQPQMTMVATKAPLKRLTIKNAPRAFTQLGAEMVVCVLVYLPPGIERHRVAGVALNREHRARVMENTEVWFPLCTGEPWFLSVSEMRQQQDLRADALSMRLAHSSVVLATLGVRRPEATLASIAETMGKYASVAGVQQECLSVLIGRLHDEKTRRLAIDTNVAQHVIRTLRRFVHNPELQLTALHCVVFLARPFGGAEGMVFLRGMSAQDGIDALLGGNDDDDGIEAVIRSMTLHLGREDVQAMGCWSLVNLALNHSQKLELIRLGGLDLVLNAMRRHAEVHEVQFRALFALINLVIPEGALERILRRANPMVVFSVLAALQTFPDSEKLVRCGSLVLHNISLDERNLELLLSSGCCKALMRAARTHNDPDVKRSAISTLRRLGVVTARIVAAEEQHQNNNNDAVPHTDAANPPPAPLQESALPPLAGGTITAS